MDFTNISFGEILATLTGVSVLVTWIWGNVGKPNVKQDQDIALIKQTQKQYEIIHKELKGGIDELQTQMRVVLTNHLPHIQIEMTEIKTILKERLPKK